jgi:hypothetical protein
VRWRLPFSLSSFADTLFLASHRRRLLCYISSCRRLSLAISPHFAASTVLASLLLPSPLLLLSWALLPSPSLLRPLSPSHLRLAVSISLFPPPRPGSVSRLSLTFATAYSPSLPSALRHPPLAVVPFAKTLYHLFCFMCTSGVLTCSFALCYSLSRHIIHSSSLSVSPRSLPSLSDLLTASLPLIFRCLLTQNAAPVVNVSS